MNRKIWATAWAWAGLAGAVIGGLVEGRLAAQGNQTPPAKAAPSIPASRTVAEVNGEKITCEQLEPLLRAAGEVPSDHRRELQREALAMLIDDVLLSQYLRKHYPPPSEAEVNERMAELESALKQKKQTLADLCKESHQTVAEVRNSIVQLLHWSQFAQKKVTDAELQRYYEEYRDFFDGVTVRVSHIKLCVAAGAPESEWTAQRNRLQAIRTKIATGELDFATAAKHYSQCASAAMGGDLSYIPRKLITDEQFARVAFSMKPGEISDVVQTAFALHLIKVTDRKQGRSSEFSKCKEEVRRVYIEELSQRILAQMRREAKIDVQLP